MNFAPAPGTIPIAPDDPRLQRCGFAKLQGEGIEYFVRKYEITMGRNSKNSTLDLNLGDSTTISRQHASILYNFNNKCFELVVHGKNGVQVENTAGALSVVSPENSPQQLKSRDLLIVGDKRFYFLLPRQFGTQRKRRRTEQTPQPSGAQPSSSGAEPAAAPIQAAAQLTHAPVGVAPAPIAVPQPQQPPAAPVPHPTAPAPVMDAATAQLLLQQQLIARQQQALLLQQQLQQQQLAQAALAQAQGQALPLAQPVLQAAGFSPAVFGASGAAPVPPVSMPVPVPAVAQAPMQAPYAGAAAAAPGMAAPVAPAAAALSEAGAEYGEQQPMQAEAMDAMEGELGTGPMEYANGLGAGAGELGADGGELGGEV